MSDPAGAKIFCTTVVEELESQPDKPGVKAKHMFGISEAGRPFWE